MTSKKSQEEQELQSVSKNEENQENISDSIEDIKQQDKISEIQSQQQDDRGYEELDNDSVIEDILPPELLQGLPPEEKKQMMSSLSIMMQGSSRQLSPLTKQLKSEHITQIIENSEKESQREFEKSKISENTKRLGMGAILSLVIVVFFYAGVTKDKDLSERVFLASISVIGGFGAGYAVGKGQ